MPPDWQCQIEAYEIYHGKGLDCTPVVIRSLEYHTGVSAMWLGCTSILIEYTQDPGGGRKQRIQHTFSGIQLIDINVALFSCTRAFGDGPRNLEPWSSDVDDT
ncbi:hypothetical protein TNCV_1756061 [Trichonephila clavipes]|nr:hypothetical protein TNCV_1756061 [Trichonephila clavipes]